MINSDKHKNNRLFQPAWQEVSVQWNIREAAANSRQGEDEEVYYEERNQM